MQIKKYMWIIYQNIEEIKAAEMLEQIATLQLQFLGRGEKFEGTLSLILIIICIQ